MAVVGSNDAQVPIRIQSILGGLEVVDELSARERSLISAVEVEVEPPVYHPLHLQRSQVERGELVVRLRGKTAFGVRLWLGRFLSHVIGGLLALRLLQVHPLLQSRHSA